MNSIDIFNEWIDSKYVYNSEGCLDKKSTKNNFLNVCNNGLVEVKALSSETGITRSVFYQNKEVVIRLELLRKNLNKNFPKDFSGAWKKKGKKLLVKDEDKNLEVTVYNQERTKSLTLSRHNSELEKQLQEEKAKNAKLERELVCLQKQLKQYEPSIKALIELNAFPKPVRLLDHSE